MCLICKYRPQSIEDKKKIFQYSKNKTYIRTFDNKIIKLNEEQINEIIENALYVLTTGIDLSCSIWAIQWPNDYIVKTIVT